MRVEPIVSSLPAGFAELRQEAAAEGFIHIDRLWDEWQDGSNRFSKPGERLLAAWDGETLAGLGGVTEDFDVVGGLRMRRCYIRPQYRRAGVGRLLATALLAEIVPLERSIVLHAPYPTSAVFWEAMGFVRVDRQQHTHMLPAREGQSRA